MHMASIKLTYKTNITNETLVPHTSICQLTISLSYDPVSNIKSITSEKELFKSFNELNNDILSSKPSITPSSDSYNISLENNLNYPQTLTPDTKEIEEITDFKKNLKFHIANLLTKQTSPTFGNNKYPKSYFSDYIDKIFNKIEPNYTTIKANEFFENIESFVANKKTPIEDIVELKFKLYVETRPIKRKKIHVYEKKKRDDTGFISPSYSIDYVFTGEDTNIQSDVENLKNAFYTSGNSLLTTLPVNEKKDDFIVHLIPTSDVVLRKYIHNYQEIRDINAEFSVILPIIDDSQSRTDDTQTKFEKKHYLMSARIKLRHHETYIDTD